MRAFYVIMCSVVAGNLTAAQVPRASDGKPDLTGVWQPASSIRGSWEEANAGDGLGGTGKDPSAPVALGSTNRPAGGAPYQPWAAKQVIILYEYMNLFRVIPLNAKHPDDADPAYLGDSVGHWEGDTLVVDVTN